MPKPRFSFAVSPRGPAAPVDLVMAASWVWSPGSLRFRSLVSPALGRRNAGPRPAVRGGDRGG
ncbi:hypothetical protein GCM10010469_61220 [Streptomyces labedae]|uniref:Uncharacterized protein n=2 Tax=Streptomyces TaxID=1883 RepID=A0ABQ2U6I7_9ACTN|nr:hypothetical protein GCM10010265_61310 [Streptomyces griseoincarnatus]GGT75680.1 hypothetical protein GCM10010287_57580 [Streptomyces variabilis]